MEVGAAPLCPLLRRPSGRQLRKGRLVASIATGVGHGLSSPEFSICVAAANNSEPPRPRERWCVFGRPVWLSRVSSRERAADGARCRGAIGATTVFIVCPLVVWTSHRLCGLVVGDDPSQTITFSGDPYGINT